MESSLLEVQKAFQEYGSKAAAARALGMPVSTFKDRLERLEREVGVRKKYRTHCVIPDVQAKPGVPLDHLEWAGKFIADKRPDVIVCIGDFVDFPSLSSYDKGKVAMEGRRYKADLAIGKKAMDMLMGPILAEPDYSPELHFLKGNHEDRVDRVASENPNLHGFLSSDDLEFEQWGWQVHEFLEVVEIDGISYSHYFYNPNTGNPYGGTNLETRLKTIGTSFTMGHQQGLSVAIRDLPNGKRQRGLVCGSFYQHQEDYKGPQGNSHWQGIVMKHEVCNGNYDLMEVSLGFLKRRYGGDE